MDQELIGKFIAQIRKEKNMTQKELADKIGVTDRAISNYENGIRLPDYSLIISLCDVLEINVYELFTGKKDNKIKIEEKELNFLLNTIKYYENQKYINYEELEIIIKINNEYKLVSLLLSNKKIINNEDNKEIVTEYKNIKVIEPYIKIDNEIKNIFDFNYGLPLNIFEKSYKLDNYNYFDYDEFLILKINDKIKVFFDDLNKVYEKVIEDTLTYIEENDYSNRDFEECLNIVIKKELKETDLNQDLEESFILLSILNPNYIELYRVIYEYIK